MMGLLTIVFLAALVGIAKPYPKGVSRKRFASIAAGAFVGMMIFVPKTDTSTTAAALTQPDPTTTAPAVDADSKIADAAPAKPESKWSYTENKDEMRGTTSRYAAIPSENEIDLDFPYGEQRGEITARQNPEQGLNVMFSVGKGQILCNSFTDTTLSVKFDNGPVQRMSCTGSSDGSSETAFFTNEGRILSGLKTAKRTIVEAEFFQRGRQQFIFETVGLKWK